MQPIINFEIFGKLLPNEKVQFLCSLSGSLTVSIRVLLIDDSSAPDLLGKVRGLNEIHHKVFAQIEQILANETRYPDQEFCQLLSLMSADSGLAFEFSRAWEFASSRDWLRAAVAATSLH